MNVKLPFDSKVVRYVFDLTCKIENNEICQRPTKDALLEIVDCILFLGIDSLFEALIDQIACGVNEIHEETLKMIPKKFYDRIVERIPICFLDIDFVLAHFGFDSLRKRIKHFNHNKFLTIPFFKLFVRNEKNEYSQLANDLMFYNEPNFQKSKFILENCTVIHLKKLIDVSKFHMIKELYFYSVDFNESLNDILLQSLEVLVINKTRLSTQHFKEIADFIPNSNLLALSLRETKMGPLRVEFFIDVFLKRENIKLEYLDVSSNGIGGLGIDKLLFSISKTKIIGIAIDANFFEPSSNSLIHLEYLPINAFSIRGINWDYPSCDVMAKVIKNVNIKFIDFSAQIVHQHSDPDLSSKMISYIIKESHENIQKLIFSNHRIENISFDIINHINLKELIISNSNLNDDSLDSLIPLLSKLEYLDLSYNSLKFKNYKFLSSCASSKTLKYLSLSYNEIGDTNGKKFFDDLHENYSQIKNLVLNNCYLRKQSSIGLFNLLADGNASFFLLDVSGNELFHKEIEFYGPYRKSSIKTLYLGGNLSKSLPLIQLFQVIRDTKYIDLNQIPISIITSILPFLKGLYGLSISYTRITTSKILINIIQEIELKVLVIIHSTSQKVFNELIACYQNIPSLLSIYVGMDLKVPSNSPIPICTESNDPYMT